MCDSPLLALAAGAGAPALALALALLEAGRATATPSMAPNLARAGVEKHCNGMIQSTGDGERRKVNGEFTGEKRR